MKFKNTFLLLLFSVALFTCQKKSMDIALEQEGCKNMKIVNAQSATIYDPSCGGTSDSAAYQITFDYDEKNRACLKKIFIDPTFYRRNESTISGVNYTSMLYDTSASVVITSNKVTFTFKCKFQSIADADTLNSIFFKIHTENSLGEKSKDLQVRINAKCSGVESSIVPIATNDTISRFATSIQLKLWDDGQQDGDIVSVALNDNWVIQNHSLTNSGNTFTIPVPSNVPFKLVIIAMNQGTVGPNTCALSVNGGKTTNLSLDLVTGQAVEVYRR